MSVLPDWTGKGFTMKKTRISLHRGDVALQDMGIISDNNDDDSNKEVTVYQISRTHYNRAIPSNFFTLEDLLDIATLIYSVVVTVKDIEREDGNTNAIRSIYGATHTHNHNDTSGETDTK